jgi:2-keto-3-deoxy-galactonokinase
VYPEATYLIDNSQVIVLQHTHTQYVHVDTCNFIRFVLLLTCTFLCLTHMNWIFLNLI